MAIDLEEIVQRHVRTFNDARLTKVRGLRVSTLLRRKNPYLFIARNTATPEALAELLVSATLSSSEETIFGQTLENIAIDICAEVYGGQKSAARGIDLEFNRDGSRYIVSIKSGPSWGNSSQIAKMKQDFSDAKRVIRQGNRSIAVEAINGCCYGNTRRDYGDYEKLCGSAFWELISGESELYQQLVVPFAELAQNGFAAEIESATKEIAKELLRDWSTEEGRMDWMKVVAHNAKTRDPQ